ncbi:N-acetylneuraminate synthase family protein [Candidatus Electrothrix sp.]|uniref:N-acetylneuraminate synthase family protein n=1 Tax=Candidatus Electrothrix sp. TaxID=2170559 RepID=UPI004055E11F
MKNFDFNNLYILDLANNHQGDVLHGLNIIEGCAGAVKSCGVRATVKFQFRQLETFIHPDFQSRKDLPHIPRFMETALSKEQFSKMAVAVKDGGMITMATPFDEESVDVIEELELDVIKIASCSATDYPLLKRVVRARRPIVASTAGLSIGKIDRLINFLETHEAEFAIMHCVALYPTANDRLNLNQISYLRQRYQGVPVGFSTHEEPENMNAVQIAAAKGALLFERHVGLNTDKYKLNAYSSTPDQIKRWIQASLEAQTICGGEGRGPASPAENVSLRSLMRGVYAKDSLKAGDVISRENVFFAMPLQDNQMTSGDWHSGMTADRDYLSGEALQEQISTFRPTPESMIFQIMLQVKGMLREAQVPVGQGMPVELSHHYGLDRFREFGCTIVDCVNRSYCKKLLVMLPRQKHPYHYHAKKEETFQLLHGDLEICLDGHVKKLELGETVLVEPGMWHKFHTLDGAIMEEISSTHYNDDSFYDDELIAKISREHRKTVLEMQLINSW